MGAGSGNRTRNTAAKKSPQSSPEPIVFCRAFLTWGLMKGFRRHRILIYEWFLDVLKKIRWFEKTLRERYFEKLLIYHKV